MNIKTRLVAGASTLVLAGSMMAVAAPAGATTVDRGTTQILSCNDVNSIVAALKDSAGAGVGFPNRSLKAAGISHPETKAVGDPTSATKEPDPAPGPNIAGNGTPDYGETDTCSGTLTNANAFNPWFSASVFTPYSPSQQLTASFNDVTKVAGALTGRTNCDSGTPSPLSSWGLHGKLIIAFGSQASVGTLSTPTALDALGVPVQSQVYVNTQRTAYADLITLAGIGIKGEGEGAYFDAKINFTPPAVLLNDAIEACFTNADGNSDGIVGHNPGGGLQTVVTDTDVDGGLGFGTNPADYNNSMDWSV